MKLALITFVFFMTILLGGCLSMPISPEMQDQQLIETETERLNLTLTLEKDKKVFGDKWVEVEDLIQASVGFSDQLKEELKPGQLIDITTAKAFYLAGKALNERLLELVLPVYDQLSIATQLSFERLQGDLIALEKMYEVYKAAPNFSNYEKYAIRALTVAKTLAPLILL